MVLLGHAGHWRDDTVDGSQDIPDGHASGNSDNVVLCPVVGDKSGLSENSKKSSTVKRRAPNPMTSNFTISLNEIAVPE